MSPTLPHRLLLPLAVACALAAEGCTAITIALHSQTDWGEGHLQDVTPIGTKRERRAVVSTAALEPEAMPEAPSPQPVPSAPAPPPQVVIVVPGQPAPPPPPPPEPEQPQLVGPPWGTAPVHFPCAIQERPEKERVTAHYYVYGTVEKIFLGMVMLFDGVGGWAALSHAARADAPDRLQSTVVGGVMAADAAGLLGLILFAKGEWREEGWEQPGTWYGVGSNCPTGLIVHSDNVTAPVDAHGAIDATQEALLVRDLVLVPATLDLRLDGNAQLVQLDESVRCRLGEGRHYPVGDRCRMLQLRPVPQVFFPLPVGTAQQ